jgi:phage tail-like protein
MPPLFPNNPKRFDPLKNFNFKVKWDNAYVAAAASVSALTRTTEVITHRVGGDPIRKRKSPGLHDYQAVTIKNGVTMDRTFYLWAGKIYAISNQFGMEVSLADFRKDVTLELYNEAGQLAIAYTLYNCWPSEFQAQADLDANTGGILFQHLKLEIEGFDIDVTVQEPAEPSFTIPTGT